MITVIECLVSNHVSPLPAHAVQDNIRLISPPTLFNQNRELGQEVSYEFLFTNILMEISVVAALQHIHLKPDLLQVVCLTLRIQHVLFLHVVSHNM